MNATGVVVVGAGQAGFQVAASLRERGYQRPITLIGDEDGLPYQPPPLSKDLLLGSALPDRLALRPEAFFGAYAIELYSNCRVTSIDREARAVQLDTGARRRYEHLVLATGSRPRRLPLPGFALDGVTVLRTLADAVYIRDRLVVGTRVVVQGGGFIGLEVAAAARHRKAEVTVLEVASRCMQRALSEPTAAHLVALHSRAGATIRSSSTVSRILDDGAGGCAGVALGDGTHIEADMVVVGVGVSPEVELAEQAGLSIDDGVLVGPTLRTADSAVWAVGDCCRFPLPDGRRIRLESVQNAIDQARAVGAAITQKPGRYVAVPWFWSDQHGCKLQIAGLIDGHDRTVLRGDPDDDGFSVFLYAEERLVAVESVNRPRDHFTARKLLAAGRSPNPEDVQDLTVDLRGLVARVSSHG